MTKGMRHIPLEGTYNIRDLGGYTTQDGYETNWKTMLRADSLGEMTPEAQQELIDYGVRTIIDLRGDSELETEPNPFANSDQVRYLNIPLLPHTDSTNPNDMPNDLLTLYKHILDDVQDKLLKVMQALLADDVFPALVHCTAGKDRTGVVSALLLDLAGVPDNTIAEDYALTGQYLKPKLDKIREQAVAAGRDIAAFENLLLSEPEAMIATLSYLDEKYGGSASYLNHIGLDVTQIRKLRTTMVTKNK